MSKNHHHHQNEPWMENQGKPSITEASHRNERITDLSNSSTKTPKNLPFSCNYCFETFSDYFQHSSHERQHHLFNIRPFSCIGCSRRFPRRDELDRHKKIHRPRIILLGIRSDVNASSKTDKNDQDSLRCTICQRVCKTKSSLQSHINVHSGIKIHVCRFCPKRFIRKSEMVVHERRMHLNIKPHKCLKCGKGYTLKSTLRVHEENNCHGNKAFLKENITTPIIRPTSSTKLPLPNTSSKTKISAPESGKNVEPKRKKIVPSQSVLARRLEIFRKRLSQDPNLIGIEIGDDLFYKCSFCGKRFRSAVYLLALEHTWTHTGYKPFRCKYCDRGFLRTNAFNEHVTECNAKGQQQQHRNGNGNVKKVIEKNKRHGTSAKSVYSVSGSGSGSGSHCEDIGALILGI